jgi:hypothetical protein
VAGGEADTAPAAARQAAEKLRAVPPAG